MESKMCPVAVSPQMRYALELCQLYAAAEIPILFVGSVGVGKTTLAREAHRLSGREGPFVVVSAGELTENLFTDTLFGRVPGAFTGADKRRKGAIAQARGGTLLIDDLAVMSLGVQEALLRVLESGRYQPLGSDAVEEANCQFLFAATSDPRELVDAGALVIDLASRLGDLIITVPPLQERRADIMPMAEAMARAFLDRRELSGVVTFSDEVRALFMEYSWPWNARELEHVVSRAIIHTGMRQESIVVRRIHLPERLQSFDPDDQGKVKVKVTTAQVRSAVEQAGGNKSEAARNLGVHRNTVGRRLRESG